MDKTEEYGTLTAFTLLAPFAVGALTGLLLTAQSPSDATPDAAALAVLAVGVLALAVSLLHLGRPWRAPLALRRIGASWLSREILFFGLFLILLGLYGLLPVLHVGAIALKVIGLAAVVIGLIGTLLTGEIYRLRSRPSWNHWLAVAAFPLGAIAAGSPFGFFVARHFAHEIEIPAPIRVAVETALLLSLVVTFLRTTRREETAEGRRSRQLALGPFAWLLILRAATIMIALLLILAGGAMQFLAWIPALLGELADRVLFFQTAVPVTLRGRYV